MPKPLEILQAATINAVDSSGLAVWVKTNLGGEFEVYRAGDNAPPSPLARFLSVGVQIRDGSGKVVKQWGGWPATNYIAIAALAALAGGVVYLIARGAMR